MTTNLKVVRRKETNKGESAGRTDGQKGNRSNRAYKNWDIASKFELVE